MATLPKARVVLSSGGVVKVHVSPETIFNLEQTQALTRQIVARLGCNTCTSGFQINFVHEEGEFTLS
jgi:hypothetical protein